MSQRMSITMATKERYMDNVGYLYKMGTHYSKINPVWESEPIPFRFNKVSKGKKSFNPMSGMYMTSTNEVWLSDSQVNFADGDRVTESQVPRNDAEYQDFSIITDLQQEPINSKDNRYRSKKKMTSRFTVS